MNTKGKWFLLFIFLWGCATTIKMPQKDYLTGLKEIAYSISKKIEKGQRVVVLNFSSIPEQKGISPLNIYLAHVFSSYLSEASNGNFVVIDREKGEKIVKEDMKFEIAKTDWLKVLERFQCEYYVIGEYSLFPTKEIEFVDISLMKKEKKIYSKSQKFSLTETEYNKLKEMAYGDVIENIVESFINLIDIRISEINDPFQRFIFETAKNVLRVAMDQYRECKFRGDCRWDEVKNEILNKILNLPNF
jgi:hypothetical protein